MGLLVGGNATWPTTRLTRELEPNRKLFPGLARELKTNRKLFSDSSPSILRGLLVELVHSGRESRGSVSVSSSSSLAATPSHLQKETLPTLDRILQASPACLDFTIKAACSRPAFTTFPLWSSVAGASAVDSLLAFVSHLASCSCLQTVQS